MKYLFAESSNYEDLSNGRVIYSRPGMVAFPVRLSLELLYRSCNILGLGEKHVYDPCCGGAYMLTALGFLAPQLIDTISASDISGEYLEVAAQNLSLLAPGGLEKRQTELEKMSDRWGKYSHRDAIESVERLKQLRDSRPKAIPTSVFSADAFEAAGIHVGLGERRPTVIMIDVPYGRRIKWTNRGLDLAGAEIENLLSAAALYAADRCVVALAYSKEAKLTTPYGFKTQFRASLGHRRIAILSR